MSQQPLPTKLPQPRKPTKFTGRAKTLATAATFTALLGGWNLIGHLEVSKANAASQPSAPSAQIDTGLAKAAATATSTATATVQPLVLPTIRPLTIAPLATLPPLSDLLTQAITQQLAPEGAPLQLSVPAAVGVAALPTLAPLPSLPPMPSLPPPPSNNSYNNSNNNSNSGSSNNSNSGGGSSQKSGGS